jgi:hypothetical protein
MSIIRQTLPLGVGVQTAYMPGLANIHAKKLMPRSFWSAVTSNVRHPPDERGTALIHAALIF